MTLNFFKYEEQLWEIRHETKRPKPEDVESRVTYGIFVGLADPMILALTLV
jgi:hypothetical protein